MRDQFNREIEYARISVTDRCNLRCRYCMPANGVSKLPHGEILSFEEIIRVAEILARLGIRKIRLTGGEPLLRKNLPILVRELKSLRGIEIVTLTTNGVLLEKFASDLITFGIDGINVSLDTLDAFEFGKITRRGTFAEVHRGIQFLFDVGFGNIKLNCVPLRGVNEDNIVALAALAKDHNLKVRFIELMPFGCASRSGFVGMTSAEIISKLENHFNKLIPYEGEKFLQGPAKYFSIKNFVGQIGFIDALAHKFCGSCNRIRLTAEGFLKACLCYDTGADVKKLLRSGASDEELLAVIRETIYRKPLEHSFEKNSVARDARQMYQVGG